MLHSKPSRQMTILKVNSLIPTLLLLLLPQLFTARCDQLGETDQSEIHLINSNLDDPIVWDVDSLYRTSKTNTHPISTRRKRSSISNSQKPQHQQLVDACQSKMEILTPYYATNSKGKLRIVVNSELMQQAIQVETCIRSPTSQNAAKCNTQLDCGCEQKYKWHRLLVLDPRDSGASHGLFMDWFLFPSSCVCRCKSSQWTSKQQFLRTIKKTGD